MKLHCLHIILVRRKMEFRLFGIKMVSFMVIRDLCGNSDFNIELLPNQIDIKGNPMAC
jgi:hypothetical protein